MFAFVGCRCKPSSSGRRAFSKYDGAGLDRLEIFLFVESDTLFVFRPFFTKGGAMMCCSGALNSGVPAWSGGLCTHRELGTANVIVSPQSFLRAAQMHLG